MLHECGFELTLTDFMCESWFDLLFYSKIGKIYIFDLFDYSKIEIFLFIYFV